MNLDLLYHYRARIVRWVDADTVDVSTDCGFDIWFNQRLRLFGIDAWERRGVERLRGIAATEFVDGLLPAGSEILIETRKDKQGKYGRYLATIYYNAGQGDWRSVNDLLVAEGHARYTAAAA